MAIAEPVARKPRKSPPKRPDSESTFPTFRKPQLATLSRSVPTGNGWLFEMKFDGYRCQASVVGDQVKLYTRNGHDWSDRFAAIAPPLRKLTQGTLLIDGEICAIDAHAAPTSPCSRTPSTAKSRWCSSPSICWSRTVRTWPGCWSEGGADAVEVVDYH